MMKNIYWFMALGGILFISVIYRINDMQPKPLWSVDTATVNTTAVLLEKSLIFGTIEGVYCVHAETGEIQWHFASPSVITKPAVVGDIVIFATNYPSIYGLNRHTGKKNWQIQEIEQIDYSSIEFAGIVDNMVYFVRDNPDEGDRILGLNSASGRIIWEWPEQRLLDMEPLPSGNNLRLINKLTVEHDVLYVAGTVCVPGRQSAEKHILALNRTNRQIIWESKGDLEGLTNNPFFVDNGKLYVGGRELETGQQHLYAINIRTGQIIWKLPFQTFFEHHIIHDDLLILIGLFQIVALDQDTGKQVWTFQYPKNSSTKKMEQIALWFTYFFPSPLLAEKHLLVADGSKLFAISPIDGRLISWRHLETGTSSLPLVKKQSIYLETYDGFMRYKLK